MTDEIWEEERAECVNVINWLIQQTGKLGDAAKEQIDIVITEAGVELICWRGGEPAGIEEFETGEELLDYLTSNYQDELREALDTTV